MRHGLLLAESVCRTPDRVDPPGMPGPRHRLERGAPGSHSDRVLRLLSRGAVALVAGTELADSAARLPAGAREGGCQGVSGWPAPLLHARGVAALDQPYPSWFAQDPWTVPRTWPSPNVSDITDHSGHVPIMAAGPTDKPVRPLPPARVTFSRGTWRNHASLCAGHEAIMRDIRQVTPRRRRDKGLSLIADHPLRPESVWQAKHGQWVRSSFGTIRPAKKTCPGRQFALSRRDGEV